MRLLIYPALMAAGATLLVCAPTSGTIRPNGLQGTTPAALQGADGRVLYLKNCRQCHSATGQPSSETKAKYSKIKSLNDSALLAKMSDDSIATVIKKGAGKDMKPFADRLNGEEILAVVKYVRTLPSKK